METYLTHNENVSETIWKHISHIMKTSLKRKFETTKITNNLDILGNQNFTNHYSKIFNTFCFI